MPHVLHKGHQIAAGAFRLPLVFDRCGPVEVAGVRFPLMDAWLDRVDCVVIQDRLEIVFVLVALGRLVLVAKSTLVARNRSIHVVVLVLVIIRVAIRMEALPINIILLLFLGVF